MNRLCKMVIVVAVFSTCLFGSGIGRQASAQGKGNLLISAKSNCIWLLNKSTRKLIFIKHANTSSIWKSNAIVVQDNFNLNRCVLQAVGGGGGSVLLYDKQTGLNTMFTVRKDRAITKYLIADPAKDLQ